MHPLPATSMISMQLPTIQMFWHGAPLSRMERLSISSFVHHGHAVELYVYDEPNDVPRGALVRNAEEILPRSALFRHKRSQSFALFADWFRYRLLHERGGVWADADVVCLKPFDYMSAEIFAWQDESIINNAVLGLPAGHPLASWLAACCEDPNRIVPYDSLAMRLRKWRRRVLKGNRRDGVRWGENGPHGLTLAARHLGYADRALPSWHFYPVAPDRYLELYESPRNGSPVNFYESRAVHLWNHLLEGSHTFDKASRFPADSPFEVLCDRYLTDDGRAAQKRRVTDSVAL